MLTNLSQDNSLLHVFFSELRDEKIQLDRMRFRRNMERIGEIFAYEISKTLAFKEDEVQSPLGTAKVKAPSEQPLLATILRAGLPLHQGLLNYFDKADSAFVTAYRKHKSNDEFEVEVEYLSSPSIEGKDLILCDPMLATGSSMVLVYKALLKFGTPRSVHIVAVLSTEEGIRFVRKHLPKDISIWVAAIDDELTAHGYIVPGLGDAGDLSFGKKK